VVVYAFGWLVGLRRAGPCEFALAAHRTLSVVTGGS